MVEEKIENFYAFGQGTNRTCNINVEIIIVEFYFHGEEGKD